MKYWPEGTATYISLHMKQWLEALRKTCLAGSHGFIHISSAESSSSSVSTSALQKSILRWDDDGCNDNGDDDDGGGRANVLADGCDYGCDTVFQMTQLQPRTRRCH